MPALQPAARPRLLAIGAVAAAITVPGAVRWYQVTRPPEADLVITGRTEPESLLLSSAGAQAAPAAVSPTSIQSVPAPPVEIVVHVAGAVKKPGVYHLSPTARAEDAVKAAGGATATAYLDAINLAAHVEDGEQLYVPNSSEQSAGGAAPTPARSAARAARPQTKPGSASHSNKLTRPGQGTVNLNTASTAELQRLPGVGPAMAERILDYRKTNGGFRQIEQLMDVSGIGPKKFEKMREFVRVK